MYLSPTPDKGCRYTHPVRPSSSRSGAVRLSADVGVGCRSDLGVLSGWASGVGRFGEVLGTGVCNTVLFLHNKFENSTHHKTIHRYLSIMARELEKVSLALFSITSESNVEGNCLSNEEVSRRGRQRTGQTMVRTSVARPKPERH